MTADLQILCGISSTNLRTELSSACDLRRCQKRTARPNSSNRHINEQTCFQSLRLGSHTACGTRLSPSSRLRGERVSTSCNDKAKPLQCELNGRIERRRAKRAVLSVSLQEHVQLKIRNLERFRHLQIVADMSTFAMVAVGASYLPFWESLSGGGKSVAPSRKLPCLPASGSTRTNQHHGAD